MFRRGALEGGGMDSFVWWKELVRISNDIGFGEGSWFEEKLRRVVGDDVSTYVWFDHWLGGIPLKEQFRRLFKLSMNQWVSVTYMFSLRWKEGGEACN